LVLEVLVEAEAVTHLPLITAATPFSPQLHQQAAVVVLAARSLVVTVVLAEVVTVVTAQAVALELQIKDLLVAQLLAQMGLKDTQVAEAAEPVLPVQQRLLH
jgi:hypothetical protein